MKSDPFFNDDDQPIPVTRIEFEPIEGGQVRWSAWSGEKLLVMTVAHADRRDEMVKILATTELLTKAVALGRPAGRRGPA